MCAVALKGLKLLPALQQALPILAPSNHVRRCTELKRLGACAACTQ